MILLPFRREKLQLASRLLQLLCPFCHDAACALPDLSFGCKDARLFYECEKSRPAPVTPSFNPFLCISSNLLFLHDWCHDHRYDVWLLNWRGNRYSNRHRKLSPDDPEYWNFTLDDFVEYDLPAFINFILHKTGKRESLLLLVTNTRTCCRQKRHHVIMLPQPACSRRESRPAARQ